MVSAGGVVAIVLVILVVASAVGWIVFSRLRAQRLGLPPPSLSSLIPFRSSSSGYGAPRSESDGVAGWFGEQVRKFKNRNNRTAAGAYEGSSYYNSHPRGRPLDPDSAWDTRVGAEADIYYEEQDIGLNDGRGQTAYGGGGGSSSYPMNLAATPSHAPGGFGDDDDHDHDARGRGRLGGRERNPFDDDAAEPSNLSLRGVSPRPIDTRAQPAGGVGKTKERSSGDSPTERRSIFREDV